MSADVKLKISVAGATEARSELAGLERQMDRTATGIRNVGAAGIGLGIILPMLQNLVSSTVAMADAVTTLDNRLKLATGNAQAASIAFDSLYAAAQSSRTNFTELGAVYATMARAGFANITVTKAIGDAMAISGGSAQSMQAALVQLGQGMASGTLRGEELNSIMEQAPRLAKALADGLDVPIGALRKLGEQGELTAEKVVEALTKSAPKLAEEVTKSTVSVSQGMTVMGNATTRLVSDLDKAVGGSAALANALTSLAGALDSVGNVVRNNQAAVSAFIAGIAGVAAIAGIKAVIGGLTALAGVVVTLSGVLAANPLVLALLGIGAVVGAGVGVWNARAKELETYTGQVQRVAEIEKQLEKNRLQGFGERSIYGGQGENVGLRAERDRLMAEIDKRRVEFRDQIRASESAIGGREAEQRNKLQAELQAVLQKASGTGKEYTETLNTLHEAYKAGLIPQAEYVKQVQDLIMKTTIGKEATKAAADAKKSESAQFIKSTQEQLDKLAAEAVAFRDGEIAALRYQAGKAGASKAAEPIIQAIERETRALSILRAERQIAAEYSERAIEDEEKRREKIESAIGAVRKVIENINDEADALKDNNVARQASIELRTLEAAGIKAGSAEYEEMAKRLKAAITTREEAKKTADAFKDEAERIKRINEQIGQSLSDALMSGGKNAFEYITGLFRTMVLRPVVEAIVKPVAGMLTGLLGLGGSGAAFAGQGGGSGLLGTIGSLGGLVSGASAAGSFGLTGLMASLTGGAGSAFGAAGSLLSGGSIGAGLGMGAGAALPFIAGAFAVKKLTDSLFGRKLADTGIEGSFGGGGDFGGSGYQFLKGGLFRSNKTVTSPLDEALEQVLDAGGKAAATQAQAYGKALGLPVEALQGYTQAIKVSFNGLDEAGQKAAVEKLIADYQEGLFGQFSAQLEPLRRVGETLSQTAGRLANLQTFTTGLADLGGVFGRVAGLSVDAREQLIGFAGGMENLGNLARGYVENYFNRDEIAGLKAREIADVLTGVGIDASGLSSRSDFRSLVESIDVSSEQGRSQLAALLGVQGSFAGVSDYLSESGSTLGSAASQAPAAGVLGDLFANGAAAQVNAINGVTAGVSQTNALLEQLLASVEQNARKTIMPVEYETGFGA